MSSTGGKSSALVIGEALVDVVVPLAGGPTAYPGGSSANTAVALARLGASVGRTVGLTTCFADDEYGQMLVRHLEGAGVRMAGDPYTLARTSSAQAHLGADGAASYEFDLAWTPPTPEPLPGTAVLHVGSLGAVLAPGCSVVEAAVRQYRERCTISYDINARPAVTGAGPQIIERVEQIVALADIVKASDEDLETLYPRLSLSEAAGRLRAMGPTVVVVTRGGEGAYWVTASGDGTLDPIPVEVADTIGAGDTFSAGLLDALWDKGFLGAEHREILKKLDAEQWRPALTWAAQAAAVTVSRPGADPPTRVEIERRFRDR